MSRLLLAVVTTLLLGLAAAPIATATATRRSAPATARGAPAVVGAAPAADNPSLRVSSITADRAAVSVSGLATTPVVLTVAATSTDTSPLPDPRAGVDRLVVLLDHPSGHRPPPGARDHLLVPLVRVSGTRTDGLWRGVARIGSVHAGTLRAVGVYADPCFTCGIDPQMTRVDGPVIRVAGTHVPRLEAGGLPRPVTAGASSVRLVGRLVDSATGRGYGTRVTLHETFDNLCVEAEGGDVLRATPNGSFDARIDTRRVRRQLWLNCVRLYARSPASDGSLVPLLGAGVTFDARTSLHARPSASAVRVGRAFRVTGRLGDPIGGCAVTVQRLRGATQWRGVATAPEGRGGTFTARVTPTVRGRGVYRAVLDACPATAPPTRPFVVTAR